MCLEFIYTNIDPLIAEHFGIYAIEHHEDHSVGYDYVVARLLRAELRFSLPNDFAVTEIRLADELSGASTAYRQWFVGELERIGKKGLLAS